MKKDSIYKTPKDPLVKFTFDKQVADVFPDMIGRSVPGYSTIIAMTGVLASQYARDNSNCYDLGSSLGAATLAIRHHTDKKIKIFAVDNSQAMIEKSSRIIERDISSIPVELIYADVLDAEIKNASVVVLNFTLQFLNLSQRDILIKKIYGGLNPGGALILSEKMCFANESDQEKQTEWHHAFKKANGYSEMEIAQKRTALENVLIPETVERHTSRLKEAGFNQINKWFQCFSFISLLAEK